MRVVPSDTFEKKLGASPPDVQRAFLKQSRFLEQDLRHPSLQVKKYGGVRGVWQARVNREWRFYFTIDEDFYYLIDIGPHK